MDKKQQILDEIRRVATAIAPERLTQKAFARLAKGVSLSTAKYHFGSWNSAVEAAGFEPIPAGLIGRRTPLDDRALLAEIGRVWSETGRRPTYNRFQSVAKYSVKPYRSRWGTFASAVDAYLVEFGQPSPGPTGPALAASQASADHEAPKLTLPRTHKAATLSRKNTLYGEPLDFRGLRYAPVNEQGVVYLFGMVSRELGFLVESLRTAYPDSEGKRAVDATGMQWKAVLIEFEYKSSNFKEHGHNPNDCDLVVCWVHDWPECPLEVLELRSAIRRLSNQA